MSLESTMPNTEPSAKEKTLWCKHCRSIAIRLSSGAYICPRDCDVGFEEIKLPSEPPPHKKPQTE